MSNTTQQFTRVIAACLIGLSIPILGYLAIEAESDVAGMIIVGSLLAMAILLDKLEELAAAYEAWRR